MLPINIQSPARDSDTSVSLLAEAGCIEGRVEKILSTCQSQSKAESIILSCWGTNTTNDIERLAKY